MDALLETLCATEATLLCVTCTSAATAPCAARRHEVWAIHMFGRTIEPPKWKRLAHVKALQGQWAAASFSNSCSPPTLPMCCKMV